MHRFRTFGSFFGVYLALAFLFFISAWKDPGRLTPGGGPDTPQVMWFVSWTALAFTHGWSPFFSTVINHPWGVNLMWNTSELLPATLLSPVTLTMGPGFSYNVMVTSALAESAMAAFCVAWRLTGSRAGAFVAGLLYGFSSYAIAQAPSHSNLAFMWEPPLVLLIGYELLVIQRRNRYLLGTALGMVVACQMLISEEIVATSFLLGVIGLGALRYLGIGSRGRSWGYALKGGLVALVPITLIDAIPLHEQLFGSQRIAGFVTTPDTFVSDLTSFVVPTTNFALAPGWMTSLTTHYTGNLPEWNSYLGLPLLLLFAFLVRRYWRNDPFLRWVSFMVILVMLFSLGPFVHVAGHRLFMFPLPWMLFQFLPVTRDILPGRLMLYAFLGIAMLLARFVSEAGPHRRGRLALVGLALLPLLPAWPVPAYSHPVPVFFSGAEGRRVIPSGSVVLVAPLSAAENGGGPAAQRQMTSAMTWQAACGMCFSMPEGYVLWQAPRGRVMRGPQMTRLENDMRAIGNGRSVQAPGGLAKAEELAHLRSLGVSMVVVGPMSHEGRMVGYMTGLLGAPSGRDGNAYWWSGRWAG